ncbi:MAG: M18 family aminopeptidase [Oscillospiraceae bacterium]|nr:M18 family aminopeptidase [Oscillospiraceae bacterium]
MLDYIRKSPTCFHAVKTLEEMLSAKGYEKLAEGGWQLKKGGRYYTVRNGSSLIAFRVPEAAPHSFMLTAAHTDSPCFRLRDNCALGGDYSRLLVERYGGMINAPWTDRPLSIAGRVLVRTENGIESRLIDFEKPVALIPNLAIHLNRDANNGLKYDTANELFPLYGGKNADFKADLAELLGCEKGDILASDLFVYNPQPGVVWGSEGEFVSSPRLDDLACVWACAKGFLESSENDAVPVLCAFDNEEIGSDTKQGAGSMFLPDTLNAICESLGITQAEYRHMLTQSMMLSCDNGHARHPNRPDMADKNEAPVLNGGVVIKHSVRYTTDAVSSAVFSEICRKADVGVQHYSNRPDQMGGSTLGNIANTKTGVSTVDIGIAQLAMHSAFETAGSRDVDAFVKAVAAFYSSTLTVENGKVEIK